MQTIHKYINYDDLIEQLGYISHKPRLGTLGRAIIKAHKDCRSNKMLKALCNSYYDSLRNLRKGKRTNEKQNS